MGKKISFEKNPGNVYYTLNHNISSFFFGCIVDVYLTFILIGRYKALIDTEILLLVDKEPKILQQLRNRSALVDEIEIVV